MVELAQFCLNHDIDCNAIHASRVHGKHLDAYTKVGGLLYVDEQYFISKRDASHDDKMFSQDIYYFLCEEFSDTDMAREAVKGTDLDLMSMVVYLGARLFRVNDKSIIDTRTSDYCVAWHKYCVSVDAEIKKREPRFNVSQVLDRRMSC